MSVKYQISIPGATFRKHKKECQGMLAEVLMYSQETVDTTKYHPRNNRILVYRYSCKLDEGDIMMLTLKWPGWERWANIENV